MSQSVVYKRINLVCLAILFFFACHAEAALLRVRMPYESATVGSIISVPLTAETETAVNAISATIQFPNFIKPISVSYAGTPVSLWIVPPTIDSENNTVTAEGIILDEGLVGSADVLSIQMRVVGPGEGYVTLLDGSLLARDGTGTNVLGSLEDSARFVVSFGEEGVTALPVGEPPEKSEVLAPKITRYSSRIKTLEDFFVEGTTLGDATVHIALELDNTTERFDTTSDAEGHFYFRYPLSGSEGALRSSTDTVGKNFLATAFTIQGLEYQFWVWAERGAVITPETTPAGIALEGVSWKALSLSVNPSTLLIIIAALAGFLVTTALGLFILRALNKNNGAKR